MMELNIWNTMVQKSREIQNILEDRRILVDIDVFLKQGNGQFTTFLFCIDFEISTQVFFCYVDLQEGNIR